MPAPGETYMSKTGMEIQILEVPSSINPEFIMASVIKSPTRYVKEGQHIHIRPGEIGRTWLKK